MDNFIFDVDGTLVNSYPSIADRLIKTYALFDVTFSYDEVYTQIIKTSSKDFIKKACLENNIKQDNYEKAYNSIESNLDIITLLPEVKDTLKALFSKGKKLFIYTHRGLTLNHLLEKFDIKQYFVEIVDSTKGFKRKPSGEGVSYLVDKYNLDLGETCYVGDRELDVLCADDAHIKSVFYKSSGIDVKVNASFVINDFSELINLC